MFKIVSLFFLSISISYAQQISKECFNKLGKPDDEANSEYCVVGKRVLRFDEKTANKFDTVESYIDTVTAYYTETRKTKFIKLYNKKGYQDGNFVSYFPTGKLKQRGAYKEGKKLGYFTSFYASGIKRSNLQYLPEGEVSDWKETDFKIMDYWDSTGNQLVTKGNGMCSCNLISGRREVGKVASGLRDSVWAEYSGDTLVLTENYSQGKLIEGTRYYEGKVVKYKTLRVQPEYPGGLEALMKTVGKNLRYPPDDRRMGIMGTVYVSFVVNKDGSIKSIKILKGVSKGCDAEAIRVVKLLQDWYPGVLRGEPVNIRFTLPIKFSL